MLNCLLVKTLRSSYLLACIYVKESRLLIAECMSQSFSIKSQHIFWLKLVVLTTDENNYWMPAGTIGNACLTVQVGVCQQICCCMCPTKAIKHHPRHIYFSDEDEQKNNNIEGNTFLCSEISILCSKWDKRIIIW